MADDYFDAKLALNPQTGNVVAGASALVYAANDLTFTTPLTITDLQGIPLATLIASPTGVYPPFKVVGEPEKVLAKSGTMITPLTSVNGLKGDPGEPGDGIPALDTGLPGDVLQNAGSAAVWGKSLTLGSTADTAMPGNKTFKASEITIDPISGITGTDVQTALEVLRGLSSGVDAEAVRDIMGATLVAGPGVSITVDDTADRITISASGGGGGGSTYVWMYDYVNNVMPAPPATAPAGVQLVEVIAPSTPSFASWMGVGAGKVFTRLYIAEG